jgi:hypothetical protein
MEAYGFIKISLKELKNRIEKIQDVLIPYNKKIDEEYNDLLTKETFQYNNFKFLGIFKRKQLTTKEYSISLCNMCGNMPSRYNDIRYKHRNIPENILNLIRFGKEEVYLSTDCINDIIRLEYFFNIKLETCEYKPQELLKG